MDIQHYGKRINSIREIERKMLENKYSSQHRFAVKNNEMNLHEANKQIVNLCKIFFARINDKRYYFEDGIVSLPFSHLSLLEIVKYKVEIKTKS